MKRTFYRILLLFAFFQITINAQAQIFAGAEVGIGYQTGYNWFGAYILPNLQIGGGPFALLLGYYLVPSADNSFRQLSSVNEGRVAVRMSLPARESKMKFLTQYSFRIGNVTGKDVFIANPSGSTTTWTTRYHTLSAGAQYNLPKGFYVGALLNVGRSNWDGLRGDRTGGFTFNIGWTLGV